jgi:Spy/CpxP family protein refolding chaperone
MMPTARRRLVAVTVFATLVVPQVAAASEAQAFAWWKSDEFRHELNLTPEQAARIDEIFQSTYPELREEIDELDRQEARLSKLIESDAEEAVIVRHIDRVETSRANMNKTRSLMLVRIRQVLTPEQRARMRELEEARRPRNGRRSREATPPSTSPDF